MLFFTPDWTEVWTVTEAEEQLEGFKFKGPGWYLDGDPMLVYPKELRNIWNDNYDPEEKFVFCVYTANPLNDFALIANAPQRTKANKEKTLPN